MRSLDREDGGGGDREFYLEAWDGNGGSFSIERIVRASIVIKSLCLAIFGGIQPGKLRSYVAEAVSDGAGADGLLQRFQLLAWPDRLGEWHRPQHWPDTAAKHRAW